MAGEFTLDCSPLHLLHRVRQCAADLFHSQMAGMGLTTRQYVVLVAAASRDGQSQQDIIDSTGIDRSTVSQVVQTLTRKGLLQRARTKEDARTYAVTLTRQGRDVLDASAPIVSQVDESLVSALPPAQAAAFLEALQAIIACLHTV
jgi:DNA-binding MarR family transcriptional regulator